MKLIVAVDREWGIGNRGDLLARVRADLMNFKKQTEGKVVVYGSNTLGTFPGGRALKNRINIVLHPDRAFLVENATVVHSLDELKDELTKYPSDDIFAIGGASIYRQLLPWCDTALVTKFDKSFEKDVFIPDLDASPEWELISQGEPFISNPETDTEAGLSCRFCVYRRI